MAEKTKRVAGAAAGDGGVTGASAGSGAAGAQSQTQAQEAELARKRADEVDMVSQMIALYCRGNHAGAPRAESGATARVGRREVALCEECAELHDYACARIARCPQMATKTFCSVCPTHCYKPAMRQRVREVMRWSGPRMLRYRPVAALRHAFVTVKAKRAAAR